MQRFFFTANLLLLPSLLLYLPNCVILAGVKFGGKANKKAVHFIGTACNEKLSVRIKESV